MRVTSASLSCRVSMLGKNSITIGSALSSANGSRSSSRHSRMISLSVDGMGSPKPPPPGVSIRITSPARTRTVHLSASLVACDSSPPGSSQFSPAAPAAPPSTPHGCDTRRSVISETVASSSTSRSRSMPSPPRAAPAPPEPRPQPVPHAPASDTTAPALRSGCCACSSCPCARRSCRHGPGARPVRRRASRSTPNRRPPMSRLFIVPCDAAPSVPAARARARRGTRRRPAGSPRRCRHRPRPEAVAATIVPAGAITATGRNAPPLAGIVGSVADAQRERDRRRP